MQERRDTPAVALWCAACAGDLEVVKRLIAEAVDVNVWDEFGRSALTFAAQAGHLEIVKTLVGAGAWIDPFEDYDLFMNPLMVAAQHGHTEVVEYLLDQGADPTRHGGKPQATAAFYCGYSGQTTDQQKYLAAILRNAEDNWRRTHAV